MINQKAKEVKHEVILMAITPNSKDVIERAQWVIRRICHDILRILKREAPIVFRDFEIYEENCTARQIL